MVNPVMPAPGPARRRLVGLGLVLGSFACAPDAPTGPAMEPVTAAPAITYSVVRLGALGGTVGEASDMVNGRIVGYAETGDGDFHAFLWQNGLMQDLGALPNSVITSSRAIALNSAGQVVGFSLAELAGGGSRDHAFLWQNGTMLDLGTLPGGLFSRALDINDAGVIVGFAENAAGNNRAVRWRNDHIENLGTLGGLSSAATGINASGAIVGLLSTRDDMSWAFVWRGGTMRRLGTLAGGGGAQANAINASGQIVGAAIAKSGFQHAVLWDGGKTIDLGVLPGDTESAALDIDDAGRITGYSSANSGTRTRVFLWEKGVMRNLGNSAGKPNRALGIAPAGHLVGSSTEGGSQVAVLWRRQ